MQLVLSAFQLVLRRSLANWKLLSSVIVGVLVAVALISSTPLYSNTLSDLGLARALRDKTPEMVNLQVYAPTAAVEREQYEDDWAMVQQQVAANLGTVIYKEERYIRSQTFWAGWADRPIPTGPDRPKGHFQFFTNLEKHVRLLEGRFPRTFPREMKDEDLLDTALEIEAVIGRRAADLFDVGVGDRLVFLHAWGAIPTELTIKLTGIIEPIDPDEDFWFLMTDIFYVTGSGQEEGATAPLFIPEETLFNVVARLIPQVKATFNWYYYVDQSEVTSLNARQVKAGVNRLENQIISQLPRTSVLTALDSIISEYEQKLLYTQIPLFLLIFQIVAIVLYYVVTVANMVVDRQAGEIALLRSRGASTPQIVGVYLLEGLLIAVLGGAVGPFLGAASFSLLGLTAPFHPLTGGGLLDVRFSGAVFMLAAAAAFLCLLALVFPALRAARIGIVLQRQSLGRPARAPFWQRYYLDVILLVVGGVLYWELERQGTLASRGLFGGVEVDPLLLITPLLFMVAAAIIFLRLFPLVVALVSRLSRYATNAAVVLSLRYMARNPVHYGRLILLLMLAASVGMFAASFLGTLQRSYHERAYYLSGGDIRLSGIYEYRSGKEALEQLYGSIPGVEKVTVGARSSATMGSLFTQIDFELLAVDPTTFADVSWYRADFSEKSLGELMQVLAEDTPREHGIPLPEGTESLGLWVHPTSVHPGLVLSVRIRDGQGSYYDYELGTPGVEDWQYLEASLVRPIFETLPPSPLTLEAIYFYIRRTGSDAPRRPPEAVFLDNLQARVASSPAPVLLDGFEEPGEWVTVAEESSGAGIPGGSGDAFLRDNTLVYEGEHAARYSFSPQRTFGYRGVFPNLDTAPLALIASRSLLNAAGASVGQYLTIRLPGQYISAVVVDRADYFPTLDPEGRGFAIANINRLSSLRNITLRRGSRFYPDEIWLSVTDAPELREGVVETLKTPKYRARQFYDQLEMTTRARNDPLVAAGWGGILLLAFLGVVLVSALGFIVYAYLSALGRQLEFAVLRTLGFSRRQIIGLICLEQVFVIGSGMGIGTILGLQLSRVMMPFLQLTEMGQKVLPPFVPVVDWLTIGTAYLVLAVAFVVTISLVIVYFSRVAIHRALRIGET